MAKKVIILLLSIILVSILPAACAGQTEQNTSVPAENTEKAGDTSVSAENTEKKTGVTSVPAENAAESGNTSATAGYAAETGGTSATAEYSAETGGTSATAGYAAEAGGTSAPAENAESTEKIEESWDMSVPTEITEDIQNLFDKALADLDGVDYSPVAVLGVQNGTYCILCKAAPVYPDAKISNVLVYINEDGVQNIYELWIEKHSTKKQ